MLVGHRVLGIDAAIMRIRKSAGQAADALLRTFESLDPDVALPEGVADSGELVLRLGRLTRHECDRLIDDRLRHASLPIEALGRVDRCIVHTNSAGYPLLAVALVHDILHPDRPQRATRAAGSIIRALDTHARDVIESIALVRGVLTSRAESVLDPAVIQRVIGLGLVADLSGGLEIATPIRVPLSRAMSPRVAELLQSIVDRSGETASATASEYIAAARGLDAGVVTASRAVRGRVALLAATALGARSLAQEAAHHAEVAQDFTPNLLPEFAAALAEQSDNILDPLLLAAESSTDPQLVDRLSVYVLRSIIVTPLGYPMEHGSDRTGISETTAGLIRDLLELDRARMALDSGHFDLADEASQALLAEHVDPLIGLRAVGLMALSAGMRGATSELLTAVNTLRTVMSRIPDWSHAGLATTMRTLCDVRTAAASVAMPLLTLVDDDIDRSVTVAARVGDTSALAFAYATEHVGSPTPQRAAAARRSLEQLPHELPRCRALAAVQCTMLEPDALEVSTRARQRPTIRKLSLATGVLNSLDTDGAETALAHCLQLAENDDTEPVTLRLIQAYARTLQGEPTPIDDIDTDGLPPLLHALAEHIEGVCDLEPERIVAAAATIASTRHFRVASAMIDQAQLLGLERETVERSRDELRSRAAVANRSRNHDRWLDRDVTALAAAGLTDFQIAELVGMPLGVVRSRARSIMSELGLADRDALAEPR